MLGAIIARTLARENRPPNHTVHVDTIFLETRRYHVALGLLLALAFMVRNTVRFELERRAAERGVTLVHPLTGQPVKRLTTGTAMSWFLGVQIVAVQEPGGSWRRLPAKLRDGARTILELLDVPLDVFTTPTARMSMNTSSQRKLGVRVEEKSECESSTQVVGSFCGGSTRTTWISGRSGRRRP